MTPAQKAVLDDIVQGKDIAEACRQYCEANDIIVDTFTWDYFIIELWKELPETIKNNYKNRDDFDLYASSLLI